MRQRGRGMDNMTNKTVWTWTFLFLAAQSLYAQSLWPLRAGGDQPDSGRAIAYSVNDNVFVTGTFETSVNDSATFGSLLTTFTSTNNSTDIYVGKLNDSGDWNWMASVSGDLSETSHEIAVDRNDTAYVTGEFSGTISFIHEDGTPSGLTLTSAGTQAFVAAINEDGDWLWAQSVVSSVSSRGYGISAYTNSFGTTSIYVCGEFNGTASFGSVPALSTSHVAGFVGMLKSDGNWRWARKVDGTGDSAILDIATGPGLNFEGIDRPYLYLTGYFTGSVSFGGFSKTSNGGRDFFFAKIACNAEMIDVLTVEKNVLEALRAQKATQKAFNEYDRVYISTPGLQAHHSLH